jgi:glycosyltransferase involved in cell wall biosynthesis
LSDKKIKLLTLGDHPFSPSGVGGQTKLMIEGLLETGKYSVISLGGALKHPDPQPVNVEKWGGDWKIFPVGGKNNTDIFGTPEIVRSILRTERIDVVWIMTDPRWWKWLWQIEDEIRAHAPIVYYHVWDNYPYPQYNKVFYNSNDTIVTISKLTSDIVKNVAPDVPEVYLPHTVDTNVFKKFDEEEVEKFRASSLGEEYKDKMLFFWNNRNARRKMSASVLWWFKEFLDEVGEDNAAMIMHTDPTDPHGTDLPAVLEDLGLTNGQIMLSTMKYSPEHLAMLYNMVDCTINIADAEGFGLSTLESLACETPIIVNLTGGLQEQVTDGEAWFGIGIEPSSKAIIGSQQVPYIYEDRVSREDVLSAFHQIYNMEKSERRKLGMFGRQHVLNNYGYENFCKQWDTIISEVHEKFGSWETRQGYSRWELREVS